MSLLLRVQLLGCDIPNCNPSGLVPNNDLSAIARINDRSQRLLARLEFHGRSPGFCVPEADQAVFACDGYEFLVGRERDCSDEGTALDLRHDIASFSGIDIPKHQRVARSSRQTTTVGREFET